MIFLVFYGDSSLNVPTEAAAVPQAVPGLHVAAQSQAGNHRGWAQVNGWRGETDTLEKMKKRVALRALLQADSPVGADSHPRRSCAGIQRLVDSVLLANGHRSQTNRSGGHTMLEFADLLFHGVDSENYGFVLILPYIDFVQPIEGGIVLVDA